MVKLLVSAWVFSMVSSHNPKSFMFRSIGNSEIGTKQVRWRMNDKGDTSFHLMLNWEYFSINSPQELNKVSPGNFLFCVVFFILLICQCETQGKFLTVPVVTLQLPLWEDIMNGKCVYTGVLSRRLIRKRSKRTQLILQRPTKWTNQWGSQTLGPLGWQEVEWALDPLMSHNTAPTTITPAGSKISVQLTRR